MLLPPDLRDWVAKDDLAHFILDAVAQCDLRTARLNERGSGDRQYPPGMMLALLIYCYAHQLFSSRKIERATYHHVSVRYLCGNQHPDHDTIAAFRRANAALLENCFFSVLELAKELKAFRSLGTVSLDGTKLAARASRDQNRSAAELAKESEELQQEIAALVVKAEQADATEGPAPDALRQELQDKAVRRAALLQAKAQLAARQQASRQEYQQRAQGPAPKPEQPEQPEQPEDPEPAALPDPDEPSPPSCFARGTSRKKEASAEPARAVGSSSRSTWWNPKAA